MTRNHLLAWLLPLFLAVACSRDDPPADGEGADATEAEAGAAVEDDRATAGDSSRTALDWTGTYSGVLPCASCPGIETRITLAEDGSFERSTFYIDESSTAETDSGRFSWNNAGSRIILESAGGDLQQYLVGENSLIALDRSGERITGELAGQYILQKHTHDPDIEGQRWQLVELRGEPVAAGDGAEAAVLTLRPEDSVASGNSSCNTFSGGYALKSGQRIAFARNMAVTMKACPNMDVESAFLDVLNAADGYVVSDGTLTLTEGRTTPLARFEATDDESSS